MINVEMAQLVGEGLIDAGYLNRFKVRHEELEKSQDGSTRLPPYIAAETLEKKGLNLLKIHGLISDEEIQKIHDLQSNQPDLLASSMLYVHVEEREGSDIVEFRLGHLAPM